MHDALKSSNPFTSGDSADVADNSLFNTFLNKLDAVSEYIINSC